MTPPTDCLTTPGPRTPQQTTPPDPRHLLAECRRLGVELAVRGDHIHLSAPAGVLSRRFFARLKAAKGGMLPLLREAEGVPTVPTTAAADVRDPVSAALMVDTLRRARRAADLVQNIFTDSTIEVAIYTPDYDCTGISDDGTLWVEVRVNGDSGGYGSIVLHHEMTTRTMGREIGRAAALATLNAPAREAMKALDDHGYPDFA